jgi:hypothetical protein
MSKAEIQSWIAASEAVEADDEEMQSFQWTSFHDEAQWSYTLAYIRSQILTSSTRHRIEFLKERLIPLVSRGGRELIGDFKLVILILILLELTTNQLVDIFNLLKLTYPRYIDAPSREAVEAILHALVLRGSQKSSQDSAMVRNIVKWLTLESTRVARQGSSK